MRNTLSISDPQTGAPPRDLGIRDGRSAPGRSDCDLIGRDLISCIGKSTKHLKTPGMLLINFMTVDQCVESSFVPRLLEAWPRDVNEEKILEKISR